MQNFNLSLSKSADYEAIDARLAEAIVIFGATAIGLNLVELALKGQLTPQDIANANLH